MMKYFKLVKEFVDNLEVELSENFHVNETTIKLAESVKICQK